MPRKSKQRRVGRESPAQRVAIERKIELTFPHFEGFATGISANLSTSGMFIRTDTPEPVGSEFEFSFRIEQWSPIHGQARVIWTRDRAEGPERPAGMGVHFLDLDAQSRRMIRWLVDKHIREGGEPFILEGAGDRPERPGAGETRGRRRGTRRRRGRTSLLRRWAWGVVLVGLLLAAGSAVYLWWQGSLGEVMPRLPTRPPSAIPGAEEQEDPDGTDEQPISEQVAPSTEAEIASVTALIRSWADAWNARDVEDLVAFYAEDFTPRGFRSRAQWRADLERLIREVRFVRVAISALEVSFSSPDRANATFYFSYRSDTSNDTRRVVLELQATASGWEIAAERILD